ncbi:MAG TPA: hypothetical protein VII20_10075 [Roseiarcus sp.]|jgi:hypothetical protein
MGKEAGLSQSANMPTPIGRSSLSDQANAYRARWRSAKAILTWLLRPSSRLILKENAKLFPGEGLL